MLDDLYYPNFKKDMENGILYSETKKDINNDKFVWKEGEIKIAKRSETGEEDLEFELLTNRYASYQEDSDVRQFREDNSEGINKADNAIEKADAHEKEKCERAVKKELSSLIES